MSRTGRRAEERQPHNQPQVLWEHLPKSYQKDVSDLIHEFAGKMDNELWTKGFTLTQKATKVLKEKKEFILANPMLSSGGVNTAKASQNWDVVISFLSTAVNSEISDLESLRALDVQEFLAGTGATLMQQATAISTLTNDDRFNAELGKFKNLKVTVVAAEGNYVNNCTGPRQCLNTWWFGRC